MKFSPGTRLGPYEIVAPLGAGGMCEVYRARDTKLDRDVALKTLPESFAHDVDRLTRFEREAKTLAALNHAHIAQIYGLEQSSTGSALVMELVDGEDLAARIARGPIALDDALPIAREIAEALEAAHEAGIIHRDLKPANIKVRPDGTVKVLDFGLAKPAAAGSAAAAGATATVTSPAMTMQGLILGTAAYMAPEQAKGKPVDKRADIWAFGCVLYEMVTGRRPFEGEDVTDTIAAVVSREPDWTKVPTALKRLIQHCLQKDPRRRLRDIGDVWTLLDDGSRPAASAPARRWVTGTVAAAAVMAIVAASAIAYVHFREPAQISPDVSRLHITLPTGAAPDMNMQLSPDGRRLAYLGRGSDGEVRVYVRALDELDARPLAGTEGSGSGSIFWSPDSRWLAFENFLRLKKIDVIGGGSVQMIADVSGASVIGGAWNRDGVIVFGSNPGGRPGSGGLFKVSAAGGNISAITALDAGRQEMGHRFPVFLPDGRRFLYLRASYDPEQSGIFVGDIDVAPEKQSLTRVVATPAAPAVFMPSPTSVSSSSGHLLFFRANALMLQPFDLKTLQVSGEPQSIAEPVGTFLDRGVFSATPSTLVYTTATGGLDRQLRWYDTSDRTNGTAAGRPGPYTDLALAPDATRAVVGVSELDRVTRRSVWLIDFERDTRTRLTFNAGRDRSPIWSPDGKSIVYVNELSQTTIVRKQASGEGSDEVLFKGDNEGQVPNSLSRDGRTLLFTASRPGTRLDIFLLTLDGSHQPVPLIATRLSESQAQLSPDGRWVAYMQWEVGGRPEVLVRPLTRAGASEVETKWQVSTDGGGFPRWLAGGRQLSYVTGTVDAQRVDVVDVMGASDATTPAQAFRWGPPRPLLALPKGAAPLFALTHDGKRLLAATPESNIAPRPLTIVLNWLNGVSHSSAARQ